MRRFGSSKTEKYQTVRKIILNTTNKNTHMGEEFYSELRTEESGTKNRLDDIYDEENDALYI